jgi:hypothetical protein
MSTYNPQENTPFKKAAPKVCPSCGQVVQEPVRPLEHNINRFVNESTGASLVVDSKEDSITIEGVKLIRSDLIKKDVPVTPTTPPTPTK